MKKICFVTTTSITLKSFVIPTADMLHKEGHEVTFICDNDEKFAEMLPEYIRYIPVDMKRGVNLDVFRCIKKLESIFRKERFDMVQYSTPNAACYASIGAKREKVPVRLYCQWGIRYVGLNGVSRKIFKAIEKMVCRNSTDIRAVSPMNKAFAVSEGLYPEDKAVVVGKGGTIGVDMKRYDIERKEEYRNEIRKQYGIEQEDFVYGFSGRISADKGCIELLTAFRTISQNESRAKLMIVGPVEDNCGVGQELIEWARQSKQIIMTGMVDGAKMNEYYSAIDVLVHPTYREGFGMVLQEAGALGIAIITTKIPGASEVMEEGVSCVLVEPKNSVELENAMRELLTEPEICVGIGQAAYERTRRYYERSIMLENQRVDYMKLLGEQ